MKRTFYFLLFGLLVSACGRKEGVVVCMETSAGSIRVRLYDETPLHRDNMVKLVKEGFYDGILFHRVIPDFMIQAGDPASREARPGMVLGDKGNGYTLKAEIRPALFHKKGVLAAAREGDNINPERNSSGSHFYLVQGRVFASDALKTEVETINHKRYTALFNRLKAVRKAEIARFQAADDYESLMRINRELSDATRKQFEQVRLVLSPEQEKAYTTVGGIPHLDGEYTVFGEIVDGLEVIEKIASVETDENDRPLEDIVIRRMTLE